MSIFPSYPKVQNLLYPESEPEQELPNNLRPHVAPKNNEDTLLSIRDASSLSSNNNSLARLTQEERETVIQQFVRQGCGLRYQHTQLFISTIQGDPSRCFLVVVDTITKVAF